ncbi:MAG: ornithine carbamoyltransferase [Thermoleophilia bacterium]
MSGSLPGGSTPHPALRGASVLTLQEFPPEAVAAVLDTADALADMPRAQWPAVLGGRQVALIFERPSTRTRVSFEVAVNHLGGHAIVLAGRDMQMGRGETVQDTAKVLSRMVDAIVLRTGPHSTIQELAAHADVPVINALTYEHHPCQGLADVLTVRRRFGDVAGRRVAYVGDGTNCCISLMIAGALSGMQVVAACPPGYEPDPDAVAWANEAGRPLGGGASAVTDPHVAVADADAVYTDTWVSMGDEEDAARRRRDLADYAIDDALLASAAPGAVVLHPLPAHHGEEVTAELLHGPRSAVWDQAENRIYAQAALLAHVLG